MIAPTTNLYRYPGTVREGTGDAYTTMEIALERLEALSCANRAIRVSITITEQLGDSLPAARGKYK
jgi:hypothetical protein